MRHSATTLWSRRLRAGVVMTSFLVGFQGLYTANCSAQAPGNSPASSQNPGAGAPATLIPVREALKQISKFAAAPVLAASNVQGQVPPPPVTFSSDQVDQQIGKIVKALPAGTSWGKLYVPPPAQGRPWDPDALSSFALAQVKLFGKIGAPPPGTVEILGQRFRADSAKPLITSLNLKLVYLLTFASPQSNGAGAAGPVEQKVDQWMQLPRDQQVQLTREQATQILHLDEGVRQDILHQVEFFDKLKDELEKQMHQEFDW